MAQQKKKGICGCGSPAVCTLESMLGGTFFFFFFFFAASAPLIVSRHTIKTHRVTPYFMLCHVTDLIFLIRILC